MATPTIKYPGKDVCVKWDKRLCIHIGECVRAQGDLFTNGRQPWCQPDLTDKAEVIKIVERCPSGALVYEDLTGNLTEHAPDENTVTVIYKGPLFFKGELDIENAPETMPGVKYRAALCRCGASKNLPFCDNRHEAVKFSDCGAVGEQGEVLSQKGGKLKISPTKNGPIVVEGNLSILASSGRLAWQGTSTALCRCGASKNKPFCDGSHAKIGFKSE